MIATSSVSIVNVNDGATGATGPQGVSVTKVVEEYRLSNSNTELTGSGTGYTWSETKPDIPSGKYLWIRERTDLSNNTSSYGTAHCDIVISGLVQDVDRNSNAITSKVWESDITTKINEYDGSTGAAIRDRVTQTETSITGITSRVSDVESETDSLGTRMTSAESSITQNANNIALKVSQDGVISSINQSPETIKISASKVNIEGAVTFSSFDSTLQNRLTTAESDASTAKSDASSAVSTANTASSNASSALTKVNNSIKSTTMHYLATSASSGVTTSTSGWTTTIQSITKDKPYLWTYQTVTKINDTTSNTDPVISGVYGATGGKGDTGTGVTKVEQLYRTSNSTTAPAAPTSAVSSTSTSYNTWTLAMPTYNTSYPYYYICTQTTYDNGTVKWTTVSRSKALEDANSTANTANTNASNAVSTANTANTNASNAVSTANTANTNASNAVTTANQAKSKADSAASLLSTWTGDATLATTTINGGYIKTHTIESTHLATNAIMSQNYTGLDNSHFSSEGSYLDLSTGNFYTPKFGVSAEGQGGAYINGEVVATSGRFGNDTSYWNIATVYDYNSQPHASLVGTGSPYLQTGNWQVSDNAVATRKYTSTSESAGNATYYKDSDTNTFYDVGMKIPTDFSSTAATNDVGRYNKAFYYGRKYTGNNPPTVEGNWVYFYMLDTSGNLKTAGTITTGGDIYEGGTKLSEKYAAISDVGSVYLPKTGGTITGNLTVNGSFTTNLQVQTNLASTSAAQLTGNANATVTHGVTGTLGVGNGGTGQTTAQNAANAFINALSTGSTTSMLRDADYFISQYIGGGTSNTKYYRRPISTIWDYIENKIETTYDITNTYRRLDDNDFDTINVTDLTAGNLIVNGAARFTNDVFADTFTGNLVGTASNAVEFSSNQSVSLTGDTTGSASSKAGWSVTTTTNKLTYQPQLTTQAAIDGFIEASKFMVATFKTTDANNIGMASNDGMIMSLAWQSTAYGAQLALDDITTGVLKIRGRANSVWGDWRTVIHDGNYTNYTVTKTGTGASGTWGISISGNAATATTATTADKVGNNLVILLNSGTTEGTNKFTYNGSAAKNVNITKSSIGLGNVDNTADANKTVKEAGKVTNTLKIQLNGGTTEGTNQFSYDGSAVKNINITKSSVGLGNVENTALSTWAGSVNLTTTKVGALAAAAAKGVDTSISAASSSANLPTSAAVAAFVEGKGYATSTEVTTFVEGKGYVTSSGVTSVRVQATSPVVSSVNTAQSSTLNTTISLADAYGDTKNPYGTKTKNYVLAGPTTGNAAAPTFRALVADDIPTITPAKAGLGNVTNDKQVKGLSSGTTSGHLVSWGANGYTVADSGIAVSSVNKTVKSLASNNDGKIVLTYLDGTTSDPIEVKIIGSSGSSVSYADALNVNGTAVGGAEQPVYINNQGKPATANKIPKLNNTTTGGAFYAPTSTGTANQVLVSSGTGAPTWTNQSSLSVGSATNATTATTASKADKLTTGRTISLTGDVTGSTTFDGSGNVSITATVADNSHQHTVTNITTGNSSVQAGLDPITATMIGSAASNKTFGLPANAITIQYSTNGGSTWTDYGASDAQKKALFAETRGFGPILGKSSSASTNTVNNQLRVIIEPTDRYVSLHGIYVWMSSNGNTCVMDLERSTIGAKDTFTSVFTNQPISGWSGNNIRYFSSGSFGGGASQTGNFYKYRITFKQTAVNTSYNSAQIIDIRFIGNNVWSSPNTMVSKNHMYSWDENLNVTFPANITANTFVGTLSGNASTATKFASNQSVTLTGDVTGTASSQAGWSISTTLSNSGVTADSYGPSANASPSHGGTFSVPYITVDAKGRITSASTKTITLPLSGNTDTKVTQTAVTASSYTYWRPLIFGHSNSATEGFSPSTVTDQVYATSTLSVQPSSGTIRATTFKGDLSGTATYSNYPNLVSINEIRFNNKPSDATDIHIGYKWADGTSDAKINSYKFENGNAALTNVYANTFYGALSGNAATSTKWASAQTVYVALGTASKTTSIQGGSSSAVTLGVDGVLGVANGGTGAASFTANSVIMSGSTTTGAFTTRAVTNNTSASAVTANTNLITANTLAYWTGSSNLTTCKQGTFGAAATYSVTTSVTSGSSALVTSGGVSSALGSYVTLSTTQTISGTKTFSAATSFTNTTASTSKSTGAVKVSGGLGVAGQISANTAMIGDAVSLVYDSSISALCFQFA